MSSNGGPRTAGLDRTVRPRPYGRQVSSSPAASRASLPPSLPDSKRRSWKSIPRTQNAASGSTPIPASTFFPPRPASTSGARSATVQLPPPSPNYVPRSQSFGKRKADGAARTERATQTEPPATASRGQQADMITATNVLLGKKFAVLADTFRPTDLQLVATYIQVHGGLLKVVGDGEAPDPTSHYALVPTVAQTDPDREPAVIALLAQENEAWYPIPTVTSEWIVECVQSGSIKSVRPEDPDGDRINDILGELVALEEMGLRAANERSEAEADRGLRVSHSLMIRGLRAMLPNTQMWREKNEPRNSRLMSNDEVVYAAEQASRWQRPDPPCPVANGRHFSPRREEWQESALDTALVHSHGPTGATTDEDRGSLEGRASMLLDEDLSFQPFKTPPKPAASLEDKGSEQKPIVIDDSDED